MVTQAKVEDWPGKAGVKMVTLTSPSLQVRLLSLGATVHSVIYPGEEEEEARDVVLGFDKASGYEGTDNPFFWGTTGRMTNRITEGKVVIDGESHQLSLNDFGTKFRHHVHGGKNSFDRKNWEVCLSESGDGAIFSLLSPHLEEGYPGNLLTTLRYTLDKSSLKINITATTDRATVVNISNHAYFNLAGHGSGWEGLAEHKLQVLASDFTPDDNEYLPTGEVLSVDGTEYDFSQEKKLREAVLSARGGEGFCVNYCTPTQGKLSKVAVLSHSKTSRVMEVWSDQPGLELYTGNFLPDQVGLEGKGGARYNKWGGICLMTQNYRDASSHPSFPSPLLRPGQTYTHAAEYRFL